MKKIKPKIRIKGVIREDKICPDNLLPGGEVCPQCGKRRGPSGVSGGSWVHY